MSKHQFDMISIRPLIKATCYSLAGLKAAFVHERAFRQEVVLFVILAPVAMWLGRTGIERSLLVGSLLLVLIVELLNSAIEAVVNRLGTKRHKLSGRAKDMGSAAVLLAILLAVTVWACLLYERL